MIQWDDIYKVVSAMVPLYVALILGYGSIKWWHIFTAEQCDGINRFVCYFIIPLYTFQFTAAHANVLQMNYLVLAADAISKLIAVLAMVFWAKIVSKQTSWSITSFSLSSFPNLLIVGLPILQPMYGQIHMDLVVQLCVAQATIWTPILLLFLEFWKLGMNLGLPQDASKQIALSTLEISITPSSQHVEKDIKGTKNELGTTKNAEIIEPCSSQHVEKDINKGTYNELATMENPEIAKPSLWRITKIVGAKLAFNPMVFSCVLGLIWAVIAQRFSLKMPNIIDESIQILAKAGIGTAMFNNGIFIAMQSKVFACGAGPTMLAMILRFVYAPIATALGALAVRLRGDVLRLTIIQAALPQAITTFVFAKEYGLHANVLSAAVVFGTLISLPVLVAYYVVLGSIKM